MVTNIDETKAVSDIGEVQSSIQKWEDLNWIGFMQDSSSHASIQLPNGNSLSIVGYYGSDWYTFKTDKDNVDWKEFYPQKGGGYSKDVMKNIFEDLQHLDKDGNLPQGYWENKAKGLTKEETSENEAKILTADDLEFKLVPMTEYDQETGEPCIKQKEAAFVEFENGYGMLVKRDGSDKFLVSLLDQDGKITCGTEISSVRSKKVSSLEELNEVMKDAQNLDMDGCIRGRELSDRGKELKLIGACERGDVNTVQTLINGGVNINININLVRKGEDYAKDSIFDLVHEATKELQSQQAVKRRLELLKLLARNGLSVSEERSKQVLAEIENQKRINEENRKRRMREQEIENRPKLIEPSQNLEPAPFYLDDYMSDLKYFIKERVVSARRFLMNRLKEGASIMKDAAKSALKRVQNKIQESSNAASGSTWFSATKQKGLPENNGQKALPQHSDQKALPPAPADRSIDILEQKVKERA